ncbi:MAG: hypothetical protein ACTSXQ_07690 [Alphaproteobacteria bacterium]
MNKKPLAMLSVILLMTACRSLSPVYNVDSASFYETASNLPKVEKAIIRAGYDLGWSMKKVSLGKIVATLPIRRHLAVVDIYYTRQSFDIKYKKSENLKFNAEKNTIHPNYNGWIKKLERTIMRHYKN